jgi:hypothetical protein
MPPMRFRHSTVAVHPVTDLPDPRMRIEPQENAFFRTAATVFRQVFGRIDLSQEGTGDRIDAARRGVICMWPPGLIFVMVSCRLSCDFFRDEE